MINVKATIFNTIKTAFDKMRFLGENDTKLLKKVMFLTVLDDIYDWSDYLDDKQSVQKRLQELRANFILCNNKDFEVCRFPFDRRYVNVNTPQTNETWQRLWDDPNTEIIQTVDPITPSDMPKPWTPDPTCNITVVYFSSSKETGEPELDPNTLTTCEKMNIYINRETGIIWYIDECGIWQKTTNTGMTEDQVKQIIKNNPGTIKRTWRPNDQDAIKLEIVYDDPSANSNLELLTENDLEEMV